MSIDRRKIIGLFAASAATALAGCGGGGSDAPPTRLVWLLNLNPEFPAADVSIGSTPVAAGLPFPGLTAPPAEVEYGRYTFSVRGNTTQNFDNVLVDGFSPSMYVFYRYPDPARPTRLGSSPRGIVNYFDSSIGLDVDLFDDNGAGNVQLLDALPFEGDALQTSRSANCRLRLYAAGSPTLIYDSGQQTRTDSIIVHPRFPASSSRNGEVAVVALNYSANRASAVLWPNTLG